RCIGHLAEPSWWSPVRCAPLSDRGPAGVDMQARQRRRREGYVERRAVRAKSRIVSGIDETWTVVDRALSGDLEIKYTVDAAGNELLLYRDGMDPAILARDRFAVAISRVLALLPPGGRVAIAQGIARWVWSRVRFREAVHRTIARAVRLDPDLALIGPALRPYRAARRTAIDVAAE